MSEELTASMIQKRPELMRRFEVIKILGDGAAGVVYLAKDKDRGGQQIALKVLANDRAFDEHTIERFREELRVAQAIRHPNLVEAYELIALDGTIAFSMEFVPGADLSSLFKRKIFTEKQIDQIFLQLLSALDVLHAHGVLHRDIKLENILLREDGTIKLSDLGLMKQYQKELTATGVILGTAHYLPPEYVRQGRYDVRSEVYVLGTLLFEMVTGRRWLSELNGAQAIEHLIRTKFAFPLESLIDVTPKHRRILERALAYNPSDRFQGALEMRDAFEGKIDTSKRAVVERELLQPNLSLEGQVAQPSPIRFSGSGERGRSSRWVRAFWTALLFLWLSMIIGGGLYLSGVMGK